MLLIYKEDITAYFSPSQPIFDQMMALQGECYRHQDGRVTQRIILGGKSYFIKQHFGVGWKEILKNVLQLRWPVISAKNEWQAIHKLNSLGIRVPSVVACGYRGINPARLQSFILLEELAPVMSLEDVCRTWRTSPPAFAFKRRLIEEVAQIARHLHQHGLNHRDFYLCHFLLDMSQHVGWAERSLRSPTNTVGLRKERSAQPTLYLIDLHRAQIRYLTPRRWIIKDLSGLYFSSMDIGLTQRDIYRFIKAYRAKPLRSIMDSDKEFWIKVKKRGEQLYRDLSK